MPGRNDGPRIGSNRHATAPGQGCSAGTHAWLRRIAWRFARATAAIALVCVAGCSEAARTGRSPALLVLNRLEGASGTTPGEFSTVLQSDVETFQQSGPADDASAAPITVADRGRAELRLVPRDAGQPGAPPAPTGANAITVMRYRVSYRRTDGRNLPGVDVPYPVEGAATVTVDASAPVTVAFELVRVQAKQEPPLRGLRGGGGALAISAIADVTFVGQDLAGHAASISGSISIVFADWPDRE